MEITTYEWRDIPGHPHYKVSEHGEVLSSRSGRLLKPDITKNGYHRYALGWKARGMLVHRLVMLAFHGPSPLPQVNHKNGDPGDNRLSNLEYCTRQYNNWHCCRILKRRTGNSHPNTRYSESDIEEMRRLWQNGIKQVDIAKIFKTRQGVISNFIRGWGRVATRDASDT